MTEDRTIRVLIADGEREGREELKKILSDLAHVEVIGLARDGQEAAQMALQQRPDVLFVNADLPVMDGLKVSEMVNLGAPEVRTIVVGDEADANMMRRAMRSGARGFLTRPLESQEVLSAIADVTALDEQKLDPEYQAIADPTKAPKVIVVTGAKGGIGKSTIAANLAVGLAKETGDSVVLIDMYTQFGDVASMMNVMPKRMMTDLVPMTDELDIQLIEDHMTEHESGVKVLVGSLEPAPLEAIPVPSIEAILNVLRRHYRFVVVDMPPFLHAANLYVLSYCSHLMLVANLFDVNTVSDAKKLFDVIEGKYVPKEKINLVLNRSSKYNRLLVEDVSRTLDHPIAAEIPNDSRLVHAVNQGVPIVLSRPNSPVAQSIRQLAHSIAGLNGVYKGKR
jgi:pilus assembly protein CpaE